MVNGAGRDITEMRMLEVVREQYVSLLSHDLRGPLAAAKMAAQVVERDQVGPELGPGADLGARLRRGARGEGLGLEPCSQGDSFTIELPLGSSAFVDQG